MTSVKVLQQSGAISAIDNSFTFIFISHHSLLPQRVCYFPFITSLLLSFVFHVKFQELRQTQVSFLAKTRESYVIHPAVLWSHFTNMFSWGEEYQEGFRVKAASASDGVHYLQLSFNIRDLSVGNGVLAFLKSSGDAFIIRKNESKDGTNKIRKQSEFIVMFAFVNDLMSFSPSIDVFVVSVFAEYVKWQEKIQNVSCGDDDTVTLLSERGNILCVDTTQTPFSPRSGETKHTKSLYVTLVCFIDCIFLIGP